MMQNKYGAFTEDCHVKGTWKIKESHIEDKLAAWTKN